LSAGASTPASATASPPSSTWRSAGYPVHDGPSRRGQSYAGTDRQCRGRLLAVLREHSGPVHRTALESVWSPAEQRDRCLEWLVEDGLVARLSADAYALP